MILHVYSFYKVYRNSFYRICSMSEWMIICMTLHVYALCVLNEFEGIGVYVDRLLEIASICNYLYTCKTQ